MLSIAQLVWLVQSWQILSPVASSGKRQLLHHSNNGSISDGFDDGNSSVHELINDVDSWSNIINDGMNIANSTNNK
eukprot:10331507-Ditylum_brightwellii.AAC.1